MPREDACTHALAWLHKARSDLRNIELVLPAEDCPLDTVAFHAQQAAEKSIKALLGFLGIQPPTCTTLKNWWPHYQSATIGNSLRPGRPRPSVPARRRPALPGLGRQRPRHGNHRTCRRQQPPNLQRGRPPSARAWLRIVSSWNAHSTGRRARRFHRGGWGAKLATQMNADLPESKSAAAVTRYRLPEPPGQVTDHQVSCPVAGDRRGDGKGHHYRMRAAGCRIWPMRRVGHSAPLSGRDARGPWRGPSPDR